VVLILKIVNFKVFHKFLQFDMGEVLFNIFPLIGALLAFLATFSRLFLKCCLK